MAVKNGPFFLSMELDWAWMSETGNSFYATLHQPYLLERAGGPVSQ